MPGKQKECGNREQQRIEVGCGGSFDEILIRKGTYVRDTGVGPDNKGEEGISRVQDSEAQTRGQKDEVNATEGTKVEEGGKMEQGVKEREVKEVQVKKLPYMWVTKLLGAHLMSARRDKICKGEFVEVLKLLHREVRAKELMKEEEFELAKRPRVPVTIENWTSAFPIYTSVYCKKYPESSVALLKFMDIIRKAQISFGGKPWAQYDEEFRVRMTADPEAKWGEIDTDL
ncbi:hypothetical protein NDU88_005653 [Pleurodeles waltl]|uniref:Uncharacterized protein n=1 Tax=Pleurodeles waltl TaxID=8319 RepID=A0AAV7QL97_PLEWA|nr:hypothetical protein NDU88_005653 [Pleurodeles waltl]